MRPVVCHKPGNIPLHLQAEVKKGLEKDMRLGVLLKVPGNPCPVVPAQDDDYQEENREGEEVGGPEAPQLGVPPAEPCGEAPLLESQQGPRQDLEEVPR